MAGEAANLAKRKLGVRLAILRGKSHYTQERLAKALLGYSRSTVANAEAGLGAAREFWEQADEFLHANGELIARYDEIKMLEADPEQDDAASQEGWPIPVGVIPLVADCYQDREAGGLDPHALQEPTQTSALTWVLAGLGGIGKTQIAAHYARALWQAGQVDLLIWLSASSRQAVLTGYGDALRRIEGQDPGDNAEAAARRFLTWLAGTRRRWLVVLDDLSDPGDLRDLWPQGKSGHTVVTTRRGDAALKRRDASPEGAGWRFVQVGLFTPTEALAYLTAKLGGDASRLEQAAELAGDLGLLPLALAHAAAYIQDRSLTCGEYRARFASQQRSIEDMFPVPPDALPDDYPHAVAVTWQLSIDHADQLRPVGLARPALQLAAMLDPNGMPEPVFASGASRTYLAARRTPPSSLSDASDPQDRSPAQGRTQVQADDGIDALSCLDRLSLITLDRKNPFRAVRVHALVQRVVREQLDLVISQVVARAAADALLEVWPEHDAEPMLSQALRDCTSSLTRHSARVLWSPEMHPVLFRCGDSTGNVGLVSQAAAYWADLADASRHNLGLEHPLTLQARGRLAIARGRAGDAQAAVRALEELLTDCQQLLPADHPLTLETRVSLARWRGEAMDADGAVRALEELLAEQLRLIGPDHPETLQTRHHLAYWCGYGGDTARSIHLFEDLVSDWRRVLGPDDPELLSVRANLAFRRGVAGDPARAAQEFVDLLPDRIRINGPDHPETLNNRGNLARWRGDAGDAPGAVDALAELLADSVRVLGPGHQHVLNTRSDLAHYQGMAGDAAGAAQALQELVPEYLRVLGPDHWETFTNRDRLAHWLAMAGDKAAARRTYQELLTDRLRVLGPDHSDTIVTQAALNTINRDNPN
jgi:hypothetical protein